MVKQRRESADIYRKNGREDRAAVEEAEIAVALRPADEENQAVVVFEGRRFEKQAHQCVAHPGLCFQRGMEAMSKRGFDALAG